jgi:SAM-dependent methyltransferase
VERARRTTVTRKENRVSATELFDSTAEHYDEDGFHDVVAEQLVRGIDPGPRTGLVVDVGTGTGAAAFAALRALRPRAVLAVDISPRMIEHARDKAASVDGGGRIEWQVAPGVPAPVEPGEADVVLCASALHFLGTAAFEDWLRILRPGGRLAYTLPFAETFTPSGEIATFVAKDLAIPHDFQEAAAPARRAGFVDIRVEQLEVTGERQRTVFLCHAAVAAQ